jgi:hypothetical protein
MTERMIHLKLAMRLVLLFALVIALVYMKSPTRSYATDCLGQCELTYLACIAECPGDDETCHRACNGLYSECVLKNCD